MLATGLHLPGLLGTPSQRKKGGSSDVVIAMLAHRITGPGNNSGAAPLTGDGTQKTFTTTVQNDSGAAINTCSVVLQGWTLRTTGTTDASASFTVSGTIEFPVGTTVGTIPATTVTPGQNVASADIILSAPITIAGSFKINLQSTPANGATYIANLGFAGLRNHALKSTLKKAAFAGFGDSIFTNNGGSLYNVALNRTGVYLNAISGTTAQTYAVDFSKQADLADKLGCNVLTDFGTNDFGAARTVAQLQGDLTTMRDAVRAKGRKFYQTTMTPRVSQNAAVSVSSMTSSGNSITASVADASLFRVGRPYVIGGATQAEYNGAKICTATDTGANTVTFLFAGSATSPATGTITLLPWKFTSEANFQTPQTAWAAGSGSNRGQINAWIRGGAFDGYVEWGDAVEPSRDAGRWKIAGEDPLLPDVQLVTVSSVISTSRFNSNYSAGSSTIVNGIVQPLTGANIGVTKSGNGNTNGDITVTSAWTNAQQVGDQYYAVPGVSYISDDGLHPRISSGGKGGQQMLDNVTAAWLDAMLAA